jgi:hypothetical protein
MRLRVQVPILLCALVAFGGCAVLRESVRAAAALGRREFFPLHPGTLWVYEVHDAEGRVALERVLVRGDYQLKAQQTVGIVVEESGGMSGDFDLDVSWHPVVYYRRGSFLYKYSGVNYVGGELREQTLGDGEEKVLPADPTELRHWESDFDIFRTEPGSSYHARMVSVVQPTREAVHVRAGLFRECLRVDSESVLDSPSARASAQEIAFHYVDWYAPGVGLVKSEVHAPERARPITTLELVSFRDGRRGD